MYPILFEGKGFAVFSYGVLTAAAVLLGLWLGGREARRTGLPPRAFRDLALCVLLGALLGGRLLYVAVEWRFFAERPLETLALWRGGYVFYGGLAGGLAAGLAFLRHQRRDPWPLLDALAPALAAGHAVGRLGCFLTGCCYGSACALPWSVVYADPRGQAPLGAALHPAQLYESLGNAALALLLLALLRKNVGGGKVFGVYLALYAALRFGVEFFRGDPRGGLGPLSTGQWFSLLAFAAGCLILFRRSRAAA